VEPGVPAAAAAPAPRAVGVSSGAAPGPAAAEGPPHNSSPAKQRLAKNTPYKEIGGSGPRRSVMSRQERLCTVIYGM